MHGLIRLVLKLVMIKKISENKKKSKRLVKPLQLECRQRQRKAMQSLPDSWGKITSKLFIIMFKGKALYRGSKSKHFETKLNSLSQPMIAFPLFSER